MFVGKRKKEEQRKDSHMCGWKECGEGTVRSGGMKRYGRIQTSGGAWERQVPGTSHGEVTLKLCCEGKKRMRGETLRRIFRSPRALQWAYSTGKCKILPHWERSATNPRGRKKLSWRAFVYRIPMFWELKKGYYILVSGWAPGWVRRFRRNWVKPDTRTELSPKGWSTSNRTKFLDRIFTHLFPKSSVLGTLVVLRSLWNEGVVMLC